MQDLRFGRSHEGIFIRSHTVHDPSAESWQMATPLPLMFPQGKGVPSQGTEESSEEQQLFLLCFPPIKAFTGTESNAQSSPSPTSPSSFFQVQGFWLF